MVAGEGGLAAGGHGGGGKAGGRRQGLGVVEVGVACMVDLSLYTCGHKRHHLRQRECMHVDARMLVCSEGASCSA